MSIAVSALVQPSRSARRLLLAWALAQLGAAGIVGWGAPADFALAAWLAAALAGAGLLLARAAAQRPKTHRIDISEAGDLRVAVQQDVGAPHRMGLASDDTVLQLLPGSVRWPGLMVLRLSLPGGAPARRPVRVLPVWRDSVDGDTWRALAVALSVVGRAGAQQDEVDNKR